MSQLDTMIYLRMFSASLVIYLTYIYTIISKLLKDKIIIHQATGKIIYCSAPMIVGKDWCIGKNTRCDWCCATCPVKYACKEPKCDFDYYRACRAKVTKQEFVMIGYNLISIEDAKELRSVNGLTSLVMFFTTIPIRLARWLRRKYERIVR